MYIDYSTEFETNQTLKMMKDKRRGDHAMPGMALQI